ncbi:TetR/AcrR family transcriptional regulator [Streptomyces bluensis]|uniref:TetR/AcrR family transcriptional regulator n=1 Tax=Streptomyces bluensis TaxID=33897 RepID=A0ABW6UG16_9ACTN
MPKRVDHEQRRNAIIEALWRIAGTSGLEGVSLSQIATEAGVSKGLVQHYFRNKDEMLVHATGRLRERVGERIAHGLAGLPAARTSRTALRAFLAALLPTDDGSRTESLVANAFLIRALKDPAIADRFRDGNTQLRHAVVGLVSAAQAEGDLSADLDPARETDILLALVAGLGDALLLGHHTETSALAVLDHQLDRLAPG